MKISPKCTSRPDIIEMKNGLIHFNRLLTYLKKAKSHLRSLLACQTVLRQFKDFSVKDYFSMKL